MKLLDKKKIHTQLAIERKADMDAGFALATHVDALREARATEEKKLRDFRESAVKSVQAEIDKLLFDKNELVSENDRHRAERVELLKPLNLEWKKLAESKETLDKDFTEAYIRNERLAEAERALEEERKKVTQLISTAKENEYETKKAKEQINSLKDLAQREYEMARAEHESQTTAHENALSEAYKLKEIYQNGVNVNQIEETRLKEKESELIIREQRLESQLRTLRIVTEATKQNGNV